ncbi:MAG: DUF1538 domain-containing protein [Treponema sp.]|nr:DUF1538 domain-containing protein [Treponema sp.]
MDLLTKLKETVISVLPVMIIVLLLGFTIVPVDKIIIYRFIVGGLLLILGLTIFLMGVNLGIQPMGERCGSELTQKRNLPLLLVTSFFIGFIVTIAEPDIQVFGSQVKNIFSFVNKNLLTVIIGVGIGLFVMLGLLRSILNISIKVSLFVCYLLVFIVAVFVPDSFTGIAFDSGGATTGPMTVPFIMALGLGVSAVRGDSKNSFGLTGIASVGPVMAVLVYSLILKLNGSFTAASTTVETAAVLTNSASAGLMQQIFMPFHECSIHVLTEALFSIAPLLGLFVIFQLTLLKMTARQVTRIVIGFIYSFIGLFIFLIGVNGGFMQAGDALGKVLGQKAAAYGGWWFALLLITGLILGAIIVCAEPAVWVLSEQVENVSGGTIKRKVLLIFLSTGTAIAIGLAMLRAVYSFNLKWILIPGYIIAMVLMLFSPDIFTGIAFDSGGVASGPLTSTFVLSFTLGASSGGSGALDSFGVIALVAMMPLIAIQIMGIIVKIKQKKNKTINQEVEA